MSTLRKRLVAGSLLAALAASLMACNDDDTPPDVTPTSQAAVPSTVPADLPALPLQGEAPTAEPTWSDSDGAVDYGVRVLLYVQGLAERANLEMPSDPLRYAVSELETVVPCQDEPDGALTILDPLGVQWCPLLEVFVVTTAALEEYQAAIDEGDFEWNILLDSIHGYASALAQAHGFTAVGSCAACYEGQIFSVLMFDNPERFYGAAGNAWLNHKTEGNYHDAFAQGLFGMNSCSQSS